MKRAGWWIGAAIFAACLLWLWGVSVPRATARAGGPSFNAFDFYHYFLPKFVYGTQEVLAGRLPLWTPYEYLGSPFLAATQSAALDPFKIVAFGLAGPEWAPTLFLTLHYVLLGAFFAVFARDRGLGPLGCLAGALYWSFNGAILFSNHHPNRIACMVWLPLLFVAAERVGRGRAALGTALLALGVALQLTGGYPEFTLDAAVLLGCHAVVCHASGAWRRPPWRTLPLLAGGFALGAGLVAIQLVPLAELASITGRADAASRQAANVPDLLGITLLAGGGFLVSGMLGLLLSALLRRDALVPAAGLACCLFFGTVGWQLLRVLPGFSMVRHPLAWTLLAQFYVAWLAALGAQALGSRGGRRDRIGALAVGSAGLGFAALCAAGLAAAASGAGSGADTAPGRVVDFLASPELYGGAPSKALGVAGGLLLAAAAFAPGSLRRAALGFATLAALSLGQVAGFPYGAEVPPLGPIAAPSRVAVLAREAGLEIEGRALSQADSSFGYTYLDRVPALLGVELSFPPPRFLALIDRLRDPRKPRSLDYGRIARAKGLLDAANVQFVVAPNRHGKHLRRRGLVPVATSTESTTLFHNPDRLGEAWVAYGARVIADPAGALDRVLAPDFDPGREVVLERPARGRYPERALHPPLEARVARRSPTRVELEVETPRPGFLVLSESCFPGWEVRVDGRPAELHCADALLRGVELDAGSHTVVFRYRPASLRLGAALSALAALVLVALLALSRRRRT